MANPVLNQIVEIAIDELQPNPLQPRGKMDTIELFELVSSIRQQGVLEPLVVAHTPAGYQIIAGERRWRAAKMAGLTVIPAQIRETNPRGMLEMAIIENVQRVDLNPLDRAKAFRRLMEEFKLEARDVANRIGKSTSYISNTLRLLTLPDAIKDGLLSGQISEGHARALASIEDTRQIVDAYKQVLREDANVRRTEEIARRKKSEVGITNSDNTPLRNTASPIVQRMEERLMQAFGEKTRVNIVQSRTQTRVTFIFQGNPDQTQELMGRIMTLGKVD